MTTQVADQTAQSSEGTESGSEELGGGGTEDSTQITDVQPDGTGNDGSGEESPDNDLPPELQEARKKLFRDYHEKTQKLAEERKALEGKLTDLQKSHQALTELMQDEGFKHWYKSEKARRTGAVIAEEDLSDEAFDKIRNDPRAFREHLNRYAQSIEARVLEKTSRADREVRELRTELEHEKLSKRYPDFKKVLDSGVLDSFKRDGYSDETAYALYKLRNSATDDKKVQAEAQRVLAERRAGAVDRPGVTQVRGERVIKAKTFEEFFDRAMDETRAGNSNFRAEKA